MARRFAEHIVILHANLTATCLAPETSSAAGGGQGLTGRGRQPSSTTRAANPSPANTYTLFLFCRASVFNDAKLEITRELIY